MDVFCLLLNCPSMWLYKSRVPPCCVDALILMKYLLNVSCLSRESLISSFSSTIYPFSQVSSNLQPSADFLTFYKSHIQKEPWGQQVFFAFSEMMGTLSWAAWKFATYRVENAWLWHTSICVVHVVPSVSAGAAHDCGITDVWPNRTSARGFSGRALVFKFCERSTLQEKAEKLIVTSTMGLIV